MDKKTLTIIILAITLIIFLVSGISYLIFKEKLDIENQTKQTKQIDEWTKSIKEYLKEYDLSSDKRIKELENYYKNKKPDIITNYVTNNDLAKMTIAEKDKTIQGLQNDKKNYKDNESKLEAQIKSDTFELDKLRTNLGLTNNNLENANKTIKNFGYAKWGIEVNEHISMDSKLDLCTNTSIILKRYWFEGHFFVGGGLGFIFGKNILTNETLYGGSLNFNIGGNFK
jgi:hypothetical protein